MYQLWFQGNLFKNLSLELNLSSITLTNSFTVNLRSVNAHLRPLEVEKQRRRSKGALIYCHHHRKLIYSSITYGFLHSATQGVSIIILRRHLGGALIVLSAKAKGQEGEVKKILEDELYSNIRGFVNYPTRATIISS